MFATRNDCPDCATRLPRWARFCSGCGRHLLSDAGDVYGEARAGRWWRSRRGRVRAAALALGVTLLASP